MEYYILCGSCPERCCNSDTRIWWLPKVRKVANKLEGDRNSATYGLVVASSTIESCQAGQLDWNP